MKGAPDRLLDAAGDDPLAALVRDGLPLSVEVDVDAGLRRHLARVENGAVVDLAPLARPAKRGAWALGIGTAVVALAVGATVLATRAPRASAPIAAFATPVEIPAQAQPPPRTAAVASAAVIASPAPASAAAEPPRMRPRASATARPRVEPASTAVAPTDEDDVAREARLLRRARERLDAGDADETIALCDAGDREFPRGLLGQERSGLRILAMLDDGREGAVRAADEYLREHPRAALASRIARARNAAKGAITSTSGPASSTSRPR